jgi:hypothetical protein
MENWNKNTIQQLIRGDPLKQYDSNRNYVSLVLDHMARIPYSFPITHVDSTKVGPDHSPTFSETYRCHLGVFVGEGPNKARAKNHAYYLISLLIQAGKIPTDVKPVTPYVTMDVTMNDVPKTIAKSAKSLGVALYPLKNNTEWTFIKKIYTDENQELYHYSKNADCYRNYTDGQEYLRAPDLSGYENSEYKEYREARIRSLVAQKINLPPVNLTPFAPKTIELTEDVLITFLSSINREVGSLLQGDDVDKEFLKKFVLGDSAVQTALAFMKRASFLQKQVKNPKDGEGTFNFYGNEMLAMQQFTLTKPGYSFSETTWTCFSTCLLPDPTHVSGTGPTQSDSFNAWHATLDGYLSDWEPPQENTLLMELLKLPKPDPSSPIYNLWNDEKSVPLLKMLVKHQFRVLNVKDGEGTENPYGNGQGLFLLIWLFVFFYYYSETSQPMAKKQYYAQANISKLPAAEKLQKWEKYKAKHNIVSTKNKAPKGTPQNVANVINRPSNKSIVSHNQNQVKGNIAPIPRPMVRPRAKHGTLSECARIYLASLKCPFYFMDNQKDKCMDISIPEGMLPCYPGPDGFNTRKWFAWARGVAGTQTATNHFSILFAPFRVANNYNLDSNRAPPLLYTLQTPGTPQTADTFPTVDTGAVGWLGVGGSANLNTDYSIAQNLLTASGQGMKHRIVGAGLRVKFIGPLLNESGLFHFITEPDHVTLSGLNLDSIGKFEGYFNRLVHKDNQDEWHTITFTPVQPEDTTFHPDPLSNAQFTVFDNHFMGIMGTGMPAGTNVSFEAIVLFESIGNLVRGKSITPVDTVGLSIVKNAINTDTQSDNDKGSTISSAIKEGESLVSGIMDLGKEILPFAKMMLA